jgi:hypothetical protein
LREVLQNLGDAAWQVIAHDATLRSGSGSVAHQIGVLRLTAGSAESDPAEALNKAVRNLGGWSG